MSVFLHLVSFEKYLMIVSFQQNWDAVRGIIWDVFKYSPVMLTIVYWYAIGMASYKKSHMLALYTIPCLLQCIVRCSATQLPCTAY